MIRVFLTGAGSLLGQGIIRSLQSAGGYYIVGGDPDPRAVGLHWVDKAYLLPWADDPDYLDRVRVILEKERPQVVLVGSDVELLAFATARHSLEEEFGTHVLVCPPEVVRIADDKWLTFKFLEEHDLPRPASVLGSQAADHPPFPLVVKPRTGARSVGLSLVNSEAELQAKLGHDPDRWIIQECVGDPDQEYTAGLLYFEGRVQASVTMRRDLRDGNTHRAYIDTGGTYQEYLNQVVEKLRPYGPVNLQFRVDGGVPKLFEINARFSGSTPLRGLAGFNEVEAAIEYLVNGRPIPKPELKECVILRHFADTVIEPARLEELRARGEL